MASKKRVLVVFVDAFGPTQLEQFGSELSFLPHRRALRGILGYSSGALPTILTGTPPREHGRMCLFSKRREDEESILSPLAWLSLLPRVLHERGALRRFLSRALAKARGLTGYVALHRVPPEAFRWLDLPERDDMFRAERVGPARTFLADARSAGLSVFAADWRLPEDARWAQANEAISRDKPDLTFLYAPELDGALHMRGNHDEAVSQMAAKIARRIAGARERLADDGASLTTMLVGDHGMADVDSVIDPRPLLAKIDVKHVFVDSTMIRFWGDDIALARARRTLEASGIAGSWLGTSQLEERSAPTEGSPYGQAIWLLPEGAIFAPSFLGGRVRGMHGYDLGTASSFAALASDDEGALRCASLTDIGGHVKAELGIASQS
jgi:hypothetical protein